MQNPQGQGSSSTPLASSPALPQSGMSTPSLGSTEAVALNSSYPGNAIVPAEGPAAATEEDAEVQDGQDEGEQDGEELDLAAEQAAGAAMASLYSSLGGLADAQAGIGGVLDPLLDPALLAFESATTLEQASAFPSLDPAVSTYLYGATSASMGIPLEQAAEVPDSDEEGSGITASQAASGTPLAHAEREDEMEVDIMGGGGEEATTLALLQAQCSTPSSSATSVKPKLKPAAPSSKAKAARQFSSAGTSPAPSPGPSSLANEILPTSEPDVPTLLTADPATIDPSFTHTGSPSSFIHPKLRDRPATLPAAFEAYRPPKNGKHDESDEEDEEARRRERARRSAAASRGKRRREEDEEDEDGEDSRRYCICNELYNPERLMIACDKCEEWYHVDCVGIAEDAVELVDLFICPKCQATSLDRTTWKPPCQRPHCSSPAVTLSKYCSDYCGILVASSRLSLLQHDTGLAPESFYPAVSRASRKEALTTDQAVQGADKRSFLTLEQRREKKEAEWRRADEADARTRKTLTDKLQLTDERRRGLERSVRMVELRLVYLRVAIRRWEALCQATADELQQAGIDLAAAVAAGSNGGGGGGGGGGRKKGGGNKKKKVPVSATSLPDAQCGLDVRLVYDDAAWTAWVTDSSVEGGQSVLEAQERGEDARVLEMALEVLGGVCLETRKRCERHTGWQKVREADFQVEKAVLERRLDRLTTLSSSLVSQIATHDASVSFLRSMRSRTADPDRLIPVDEYIAERESAEPKRPDGDGMDETTGREHGHEGRGRGRVRAASPELGVQEVEGNGEYEIPADVLPFLTRAQIAQMKAGKGRI
ncbi:hypothetical protein JCM11641_005233 [Rhodosporidiobolus odoratus]